MSTIVEVKSPLIRNNPEFIDENFPAEAGFICEKSEAKISVIFHEEDGQKTWLNVGDGFVCSQNTPNDSVYKILERIAKGTNGEFYVEDKLRHPDPPPCDFFCPG